MSNDDHTEWCRNMHRIISQGGIWALPRTGLVFRKTGNVLLWVGTIPPKERWPDLDAAREEEFADNFKNFSKARVAMWRANIIKPFDSLEDAQRYYKIEEGAEVLTEGLAIRRAREIRGKKR